MPSGGGLCDMCTRGARISHPVSGGGAAEGHCAWPPLLSYMFSIREARAVNDRLCSMRHGGKESVSYRRLFEMAEKRVIDLATQSQW